MKLILSILLISTITTHASTNIIKQITHPPTPENLRLKTIESQLGISRTDWKYNIKDNEQLEVVWHKEGAENVQKWIIDTKSNPSHILSLIFIYHPSKVRVNSIQRTQITFGPNRGAIQTAFSAHSIASKPTYSLVYGDLNKLKLEGEPVRLWSLEINTGSSLEPYWHATVQLKKKPNQ